MAETALEIRLEVSPQDRDIEIAVSKRRKYMSMTVEKSTTPIADYEGPYEVESRLYYGRALETKNKRMVRNMVINPIPIQSVSNPHGGRTVTIGSL